MLSEEEMKLLSNNPDWGDKMALSWVFETKDLLQELLWLGERLKVAKFKGYIPCHIKSDDYYSMKNEGKTKIIVLFKNTKVNLTWR